MCAKSFLAGKPQRSPQAQNTFRALAEGRHQVDQKLNTHWGGKRDENEFATVLDKQVAWRAVKAMWVTKALCCVAPSNNHESKEL